MGAHSWNEYAFSERVGVGCGFLLAITGGVILLQLVGFIVSDNTGVPLVVEGLGSGFLAAGLVVLAVDSSPRVRAVFAVLAFLSSQFVVFDATVTWIHVLCGIGLVVVGCGIVYSRVWRAGYSLDQFFFNVGSVFLLLAGTALFLRWQFGPAAVLHIYRSLLVLWVVVGAVLWTTALAFWDASPPEPTS